jgi:putative Mn2+ efflux pump MntP
VSGGIIQIIVGAFLLSILHASIPNHWLPLVALSRSEHWNEKQTMGITAIAGFAHTLSTIIIGIIVGILGYKLSESYSIIAGVIAPALLVLLGAIYLLSGLRKKQNHHHSSEISADKIKKKTTTAVVLALSVSMFFSPCLEIEVYFFVASKLGWTGIVSVSVIYTVITIAGMLLLVWLGTKGVQKIKSDFLEHHEKIITGSLLILLGAAGYFVNL